MRSVDATLNYLGDMAERPVFHAVDPSRTNIVLTPHTVQITDARGLPEAPSLEREGFALVEHATSLVDLRDREYLEGRYLNEIAEVIKAVSGAAEVRASPVTVVERLRSAEPIDEHPARATTSAARPAIRRASGN